METVRYLVSSKWWEKWRDYTNFDQDYLNGRRSMSQEIEGHFDEDSIDLSRESDVNNSSRSVLYGKPGLILN